VFDWLAVIDLESTCDEPTNPAPQEIVELPVVLVDLRTLSLGAAWRTYVRPTEHPTLSAFCTRLTGITQAQVDGGVCLATALAELDAFLSAHVPRGSSLLSATWSDWDLQHMLASEARWRKLPLPEYLQSWCDLRSEFRKQYPRAQGGLEEACATAGVPWEGRAHCGLDDATNTARLAVHCCLRGAVLAATGGLRAPAPPRQATLHEAFNTAPAAPGGAAQAQPRCACGVAATLRAVKRPGPNNGRLFFSCGRYTASAGAVCQTFEWAPPGTVLPERTRWSKRRGQA
jgi:inhibitor of KinA sporulation pathway (predicted exonuclease)